MDDITEQTLYNVRWHLDNHDQDWIVCDKWDIAIRFNRELSAWDILHRSTGEPAWLEVPSPGVKRRRGSSYLSGDDQAAMAAIERHYVYLAKQSGAQD